MAKRKMTKGQTTIYKIEDQATRTSRRVTLVTIPVISHE